MKQRIVLVIAIAAGILAFFLTNMYLQREKDRLQGRYKRVEVLAAGRDLPAGTVIEMSDLKKARLFSNLVGSDALPISQLQRVVGKKIIHSVKAGDPLRWGHVDMPRLQRSGLARTVRDGMRAISVSVGGDAAVSNLVRPNDRVDILGTFVFASETKPGEMETVTLTVLQDVTVLATGDELAQDDYFQRPDLANERRKRGYSSVTFQVTPREAELLVFAQYVKGNLTLSLRNPDDVSYEDALPNVNFDHIESKLEEFNRYRQEHIRYKDPVK